jgi:hypothetical protein
MLTPVAMSFFSSRLAISSPMPLLPADFISLPRRHSH